VAGTSADLLDAARAALGAGDFTAARAAVDTALAAGDADPRVHRLDGDLRQFDGRYDEAGAAYAAAFRGLRDAGAAREAAQVAIELARLHGSDLARPATARGWIERARALLDGEGPCVEQGRLELALMACDRPDVDDLLASADRALAVAREVGDPALEAQALADGGLALASKGRTHEGFARLDAALAAISGGDVDQVTAGICFCSMLTACDRVGDVGRAEEWSALVADLLAPLEGRPRALHVHCRVAYGSVLCAAGRWREAEALMIEALGPDEAPNLEHRALNVAHLAGLWLEQGRVDEAAELMAPFEDWVTVCEPLARVHLRRGEPELAGAVLRRGLSELVGDAVRAAPLLAALVDVELARGDRGAAAASAGDLAELAAAVDLPPLRADAAVAAGRVAAAGGDVGPARSAFAEAKALLAGEDRPLALGRVRLDLARALDAAGDRPGAVAEVRAALAGFERLGAVAARDQAAALLRSWGDTGRSRPRDGAELTAALTPREREVLALVAEGLTNAQVAERLYISPKTAEHHVGRVLTKLGVRSRAEAAAVAVRSGLAGGGRGNGGAP
jgi:DNA-binding CsgD family transcriptional regulator